MQKIEITNPENVANDVSLLVDHIASLPPEDKEWLSKVYFREVIKSQHYDVQSQDESTIYVNYVDSQELLDNARYIVDWLAGLQERDPKQHGKLSRITFQQALGHSKKWHTALAKKAEQSDRHIEPDAVNAPKVLGLGDGWEVFWLKTKKAREAEGNAMGHCVGSGAYDELRGRQGVFSIRKNNVVHITLHIIELTFIQAVTKGNGGVPERYQNLVYAAARLIGAKLYAKSKYPLDNLSPIPDGWHKNANSDRFHIRNGIMHNDNGHPAIIYANGKQEWYKDGKLDREDGPAIITKAGCHFWYKEGECHREDGPAVYGIDGNQIWYQNGLIHREDGPAVIKANGKQEWYKNGVPHRLDGPAFIARNGTQYWYYNGKKHRQGGPAVISSDGTQEWWLNNKKYTKNDFLRELRIQRLPLDDARSTMRTSTLKTET